MMRRRQRWRCGADRISELPEEILHHILSFLEVKDGEVMGEVSTTWNRAWNSLSSLNSGNSYFLNRLDWTRRINHITHLLAIRQTHNVCIQSFHLRLPYWPIWNPKIQNMFTALVACNVKALHFTMNTGKDPDYRYPTLPHNIFDVKSLNVLLLRGCEIELPPSNPPIKFSSLHTLYLQFVVLDHLFIQALSTNCCNLQLLSLHCFEGLTTIQLGETLSKLKKVEFSACPPEFDEVDIRAPNLVDLEMYQLTSHLKVFNITACKALTSLLLSDMIVTEKWLEHVSCLPELQRLHLIKCKTLNTIDISSVSIQHLVLHDCSLITVKLDTPNLKCFSYRSSSFPALKLKAPASLQPKIAFNSKSPRQ
ncbi:hypothetical protein P3S67_001035 [Capsicum chacoense]